MDSPAEVGIVANVVLIWNQVPILRAQVSISSIASFCSRNLASHTVRCLLLLAGELVSIFIIIGT